MRAFFGRLSCAIAAVALLTVGATSASAGPIQIGSYQSSDGDYTYVDGTLSGTDVGGTWSFDPAFVFFFGVPGGPIPGTLTILATADGPVSCLLGICIQEMSGTITVEDAGSQIIIQMAFTGAQLQGTLDTNTITLYGNDPVDADITYLFSDYFNVADLIEPNTTTNPAAFTFTLNPITPNLGTSGDNFTDFSGPDTGNFSASTERVDVPEPAMLALFGLGLSGAGLLARRRRRATSTK